jgi:hypothetical protein
LEEVLRTEMAAAIMADDDADDDEDNDEADPATWRILSSFRILLWTDIFFRHSISR